VIKVFDGRYGPYVKHGKVNASLPKGVGPEDVSLEQALELIAARVEKIKSGKGRGRRGGRKR
jgi:DNA topoisomerase-1